MSIKYLVEQFKFIFYSKILKLECYFIKYKIRSDNYKLIF